MSIMLGSQDKENWWLPMGVPLAICTQDKALWATSGAEGSLADHPD